MDSLIQELAVNHASVRSVLEKTSAQVVALTSERILSLVRLMEAVRTLDETAEPQDPQAPVMVSLLAALNLWHDLESDERLPKYNDEATETVRKLVTDRYFDGIGLGVGRPAANAPRVGYYETVHGPWLVALAKMMDSLYAQAESLTSPEDTAATRSASKALRITWLKDMLQIHGTHLQQYVKLAEFDADYERTKLGSRRRLEIQQGDLRDMCTMLETSRGAKPRLLMNPFSLSAKRPDPSTRRTGRVTKRRATGGNRSKRVIVKDEEDSA